MKNLLTKKDNVVVKKEPHDSDIIKVDTLYTNFNKNIIDRELDIKAEISNANVLTIKSLMDMFENRVDFVIINCINMIESNMLSILSVYKLRNSRDRYKEIIKTRFNELYDLEFYENKGNYITMEMLYMMSSSIVSIVYNNLLLEIEYSFIEPSDHMKINKIFNDATLLLLNELMDLVVEGKYIVSLFNSVEGGK